MEESVTTKMPTEPIPFDSKVKNKSLVFCGKKRLVPRMTKCVCI